MMYVYSTLGIVSVVFLIVVMAYRREMRKDAEFRAWLDKEDWYFDGTYYYFDLYRNEQQDEDD